MSSNPALAIANALLGPPGRQRVRASQSLLGMVVYLVSSGMQQVEVELGLVDQTESLVVTAFYLGGGLLFYGLIRSGRNQRFTTDPGLTLPQTFFGVLVTLAAYAITGPARGALITLQVLILVFAVFSLRPAQSRGLAVFALASLAMVMVWKSRSDPLRYPAAVELIHFYHACFVLSVITVLAGRMGKMRERLKAQKVELQVALDRIGELATHDDLTGLFNRRHMTSLLRAEQDRQRRDGSAMTIAMLDLDRFKAINDNHGHPAGDEVLKRFAKAARGVLRATDVLGRWGGEEFLLMLPGTAPEQALRTVERLRARLAATSFDDVADGLEVTFSAGLGSCADSDPIDACIERADRAMYRAKTLGRDRAELA